eukprot:3938679-Rhodomonas_salina.1
MSGTDVPPATAICLCAYYPMPGTDMAYAAAICIRALGDVRRCPVLTYGVLRPVLDQLRTRSVRSAVDTSVPGEVPDWTVVLPAKKDAGVQYEATRTHARTNTAIVARGYAFLRTNFSTESRVTTRQQTRILPAMKNICRNNQALYAPASASNRTSEHAHSLDK